MNIMFALALSTLSQGLQPCTTALIPLPSVPSPPVPVKQDFDCLIRLAEDGNVESQYNLGIKYIAGNNYPAGYIWIEKAAVQGHSWAQYKLGEMYKLGQGIQVDPDASQIWFQKAADQGVAPAQYEIGKIYRKKGTPQDYKIAKNWFQKAADQDFTSAQFELGYYYFRGPDEEKNYVLAYKWLYLTVIKGTLNNEAAQIAGDELVGHMTEDQIAQGEELAKAWKPVY